MKAFRTAIIIFLLIFLLNGINTALIGHFTKALYPLTEKPEEFSPRWQKIRPFLSLTIHEDYLIAVDNTLTMLIAYRASDEPAEAASAQNQLQLALQRILQLEQISLLNIL